MATKPSDRKRSRRCCQPGDESPLHAATAQQLSEDLQLLGHPVRLQILDRLSRGDEALCVCDLEALLPIKQPTVSHHLKILRESGLIEVEREGLWAYYRINRTVFIALRTRLVEHLALLEPLPPLVEHA